MACRSPSTACLSPTCTLRLAVADNRPSPTIPNPMLQIKKFKNPPMYKIMRKKLITCLYPGISLELVDDHATAWRRYGRQIQIGHRHRSDKVFVSGRPPVRRRGRGRRQRLRRRCARSGRPTRRRCPWSSCPRPCQKVEKLKTVAVRELVQFPFSVNRYLREFAGGPPKP